MSLLAVAFSSLTRKRRANRQSTPPLTSAEHPPNRDGAVPRFNFSNASRPSDRRQEAAIAKQTGLYAREWTRLLESPMLVGIAVSAADPSGLWGTLKEAAACSSALSGANRESSANELVQAVRTEFETQTDARTLRRRCAADLPPPNRPIASLARSPACAKSPSSSMPKPPATQPHSRLG